MSNDIGGIDRRDMPVGTGSTTAPRRDAGQSQGGQATTSANPAAGAVQITDTADKLSKLEQTLHNLPEIDSERVARISTALAQGTYKPDAQKIADGLLKSEQVLAQLPAAKA